MSQSGQPLIRLEGVTKVFYTDEVETHALAGTHLDIEKGEYVSITGPSGCGKSTLLSILGLLDSPTDGAYWLGGKTVSVAGIFLPVPQLVGALVAIAAFGALYLFINRTDFGRALEATREDAGAVALVGIDKNKVFALGWGLGAALVGLAGAVMAMFFYIYPDVGASFALIAYVTVALGGFGSVFGAFAGGIIVGLEEASTALILPPSLKSVGIYAVYLLVVFIRPRGLFGSI